MSCLILYVITLHHKLHHYGIRDLANNWILSDLSNRKQFFSVNGFNSTTLSVGYGVPTKGVSFMFCSFLFHIIDLLNAIKFSQLLIFADDTCLLNT